MVCRVSCHRSRLTVAPLHTPPVSPTARSLFYLTRHYIFTTLFSDSVDKAEKANKATSANNTTGNAGGCWQDTGGGGGRRGTGEESGM